jgi:L-threonylcarbamoyladenylate synthase
VIAFPTETVYGLGADAENPAAVARIFRIKGRPTTHPLIVHIADAAELATWALEATPLARRLADRFWPGPLTIIVGRSARVLDVVTGGLPTVGLRVPDHPVALSLLRAFGGGLAAPSANRFGAVSPTTAAHVRQDLGDAVECVLDGGPCAVGLESTIVDLSSGEPAILRPGGVTREALEEAVGGPVPVRAGGPVRSPGQLDHHYAPRAEVVITRAGDLAVRARALVARGLRVAVAAADTTDLPRQVERIALPTTPDGVARALYAALREVDRRGCEVVLVTLPPEAGLGLAVVDRLRRATGRPNAATELHHIGGA